MGLRSNEQSVSGPGLLFLEIRASFILVLIASFSSTAKVVQLGDRD